MCFILFNAINININGDMNPQGDSVSRETGSMHTYEVNTFKYFNHRINFLENKSSYVKVVFHIFNLYVRIGLSFSAVVPAVTRLCTYYQLQGSW